MLIDYYLWLVAAHVISIICWMAAMLYLPRLYVYHCDAPKGSAQSETFKVMEKRLLRYIGTPAMLFTYLFGILIIVANPSIIDGGWFHVKLTCVLLLSGFHGFCAAKMKSFARDENTKPAKFYRIANEVPTVLMVIIIIMVIVKPF